MFLEAEVVCDAPKSWVFVFSLGVKIGLICASFYIRERMGWNLSSIIYLRDFKKMIIGIQWEE